jgi:hypothetical protein
MGTHETGQTMRPSRMGAVALILGAVVTGCAAANPPSPPSYTQAELKAACERQGGWWRANLLLDNGGLCENQSTGVEGVRR